MNKIERNVELSYKTVNSHENGVRLDQCAELTLSFNVMVVYIACSSGLHLVFFLTYIIFFLTYK